MKYLLPDGQSMGPNEMVHAGDCVDVEHKAAHLLPWLCTSPARAGSHVRLFKHVVYVRYLGKEKGPANATALGIGLLAGLAVARCSRLLPSAAKAGPPAALREAAACLGDHPELLVACDSFIHSLHGLASQTDPILRETVGVRLAAVQEELRNLARGRIVFPATEAWRTVYEQILRSPDIRSYRSVAWLRNEDYWQDVPGRQSMHVNYDLLQQGVPIERILILCDFFWPVAAVRPASNICRWIDRQYRSPLETIVPVRGFLRRPA